MRSFPLALLPPLKGDPGALVVRVFGFLRGRVHVRLLECSKEMFCVMCIAALAFSLMCLQRAGLQALGLVPRFPCMDSPGSVLSCGGAGRGGSWVPGLGCGTRTGNQPLP